MFSRSHCQLFRRSAVPPLCVLLHSNNCNNWKSNEASFLPYLCERSYLHHFCFGSLSFWLIFKHSCFVRWNLGTPKLVSPKSVCHCQKWPVSNQRGRQKNGGNLSNFANFMVVPVSLQVKLECNHIELCLNYFLMAFGISFVQKTYFTHSFIVDFIVDLQSKDTNRDLFPKRYAYKV